MCMLFFPKDDFSANGWNCGVSARFERSDGKRRDGSAAVPLQPDAPVPARSGDHIHHAGQPAGTFKERGYTMQEAWEGFEGGTWTGEVDVRDFIQRNYTPYEGDESFLAGPTERTTQLWDYVMGLLTKEREQGGCLDMDTKTVTGIVSHPAGYINNEHPELETIVGLQTDKPLKRALHVNGGIRISVQAAEQHGYEIDPDVVHEYTYERKTHNAGVFDVYTPEMRACRSAHIITGLPDGYGRGRIIGDYRRVALYGIDYLIKDKEAQKASTPKVMTEDNIRDREELQEQIRALGELDRKSTRLNSSHEIPSRMPSSA